MTTKLSAYTVALFFEGQVIMNVVVAGSEAEAVAQTTAAAARQIEAPLLGVGIAPLDAEILRTIQRQIEGAPQKPTIVALHSDNLRQREWPPTSAQIADDQYEFTRQHYASLLRQAREEPDPEPAA